MVKRVMTYLLSIGLIGLFALLPSIMHGQVEEDTTKSTPIIVINADRTVGYQKGKKSELTGNVILRQDSTVIYADKVIMESDSNSALANGNVTIQRDDTTNAFCQSLAYDGNREYATMSTDVVLQSGAQKLYADQLEYNLRSNVAHYKHKALMTDGERFISSKRGHYYIDSALVVFVDSVVVAGPDYTMKTDSLHFNTRTNTAYFVAPTRMRQKDKQIYCEAGYFDLNRNYAELRQNAQFASPEQEATADTILFNAKTEDVTMIGNAYFKESTRDVYADKIEYYKSQDKAILTGHVDYRDDEQTATGERMEYNLTTGAFETSGRAEIYQGSQYLAADNMRELADGQVTQASGNVVWYDTAQQISMYCSDAFISQEEKSVKAFGEGLLLITQMEGDSLFLTADTLFSDRELKEDSTEIRHLYAYHNVVGFKKNLQFVADSFSFNEADSMFRIFGDPVIWSDTSRFYADTIRIQMANEAIDKIFLIENAFVVNKNNDEFYNQVKGRAITATFVNQELQKTQVKGNAESVYYALDEQNAFIGVNKVACSEIILEFENNQVGEIRLYKHPASKFYPILQVDHLSLRLEGFTTDELYRAKFPNDIFRVHQLMKK